MTFNSANIKNFSVSFKSVEKNVLNYDEGKTKISKRSGGSSFQAVTRSDNLQTFEGS